MKTNKILKGTFAIGLAIAGVISLASCNLLPGGNGTGSGSGSNNNKPSHTHEITFVSGEEATCTSEGYKDHYKCSGCNKFFADEKGENQISSPEILSKLDHKEVIIEARPSTCTEDGYTEGKVCENCGTVLVAPQKVVHENILINGQHCCRNTLDAHGVEGLTLTYADGEYTLTGAGCEVSSIAVEGATLNLSGELTVGSSDNAISVNNGKVNYAGGEYTVNGTILSTDGFVLVTDGAVVDVNGNIRVEGASVANAEAEFGYDFRFAVLDGTVNIECSFVGGAVEANSIVVGSVVNESEGCLNIQNLASKGNGFDNIGAFRWVFANGEINCVGNEDRLGTGICMGKAGTGYVDLMKGMTVTMKNFDYGFGEWYRGSERHIGIERGFTMTAENIAGAFFYVRGNDTLYAHDYVEMEYTEGDKTATALVKLTRVDTEVLSAIKGFDNLDFIVFPTAEDENVDIEFVKWVE